MSGHASHKSNAEKPNVNANGLINIDPGETPVEPDFTRDDQEVTPTNPEALERPTEPQPESK